MSSRRLPHWMLFTVALLCGAATETLRAEHYVENFDSAENAWKFSCDRSLLKVAAHRRQTEVRYRGAAAEEFQIQPLTPEGGQFQLAMPLPGARVIDELKFQIWFHSSHPGAQLWARVRFPHEKNETGDGPLTTFVKGDRYSQAGKWESLTCGTTTKVMQAEARRLRSRLNRRELDLREAYVDTVAFTVPIATEAVSLRTDELRFGPIVKQERQAAERVVNTSVETAASELPRVVEFRQAKMTVNGQPFFPIISAKLSESPELLREMGVNVAWVRNYEDTGLLQDLRSTGLWAMATPPRALDSSGRLINVRDVNLLPLGGDTNPVIMWNFGTRVPADAREDLRVWIDQVRSADRQLRRPAAVDAIGGRERIMSLDVSMLSFSRPVVNTSFGFRDYRDWFSQKAKLARPGTFLWTWIQTDRATLSRQPALGETGYGAIVEPEQIRLQVYAALAGGCRGIGYWKGNGFNADGPGSLERQMEITQLNLELKLLEPFLATGTIKSHIPFEVTLPSTKTIDRRMIDFRTSVPAMGERNALLRERQYRQQRAKNLQEELEATVIGSDRGQLLLPIWYGKDAQYVPGQMAANDATIVVPGVSETAGAWEISPTWVRSLKTEKVAGGLKITLPKFNQTAAVMISSDRGLIREIRAKVATMAEQSATVSVALARAKLTRVRKVNDELSQMGLGQPDAPQVLARASELAEFSNSSLARRDYDGARQMANDCLQLIRILQRAHWNDAVQNLPSPTASLTATSFQTLPAHWRRMRSLDRADADSKPNLLPGGALDDINQMLSSNWQHHQTDIPGIRASARLHPAARQGASSLQLIAMPMVGHDRPAALSLTPVTVTTPPVRVPEGKLVYVSGWVRLPQNIVGNLDGAMLVDNLAGDAGALRWRTKGNWQKFSLVREVPREMDYSLTMQLKGMGEVQFDDLRIVAIDPQAELIEPPAPVAEQPSPFRNPLRLLQNLPKWRVPTFNR